MRSDRSGMRTSLLICGGWLFVALLAGCTASDMNSGGPMPVVPASSRDLPDSIVGRWEMYPAVGATGRGCSVEFRKSYSGSGKGSVSMFACHQVEGLGGLHGVSDINAWERKGRTIVLSGIAAPNIGTLDLPSDSFRDRVFGSTRDDIRFVMVRK